MAQTEVEQTSLIEFKPNAGESSTTLENFNNPSFAKFSASASAKITSAGLVLKKIDNNKRSFTIEIPNASTTHKEYSIDVNITKCDAQCRFTVIANNGNTVNNPLGTEWSNFVGTFSLKTYTKNNSAKLIIEIVDWAPTDKEIVIKSIKVNGYIKPLIVNSLGRNDIPKGSTCTFSTIGLQEPITWSIIKEGSTVEETLSTGPTLTLTNISEGGVLLARGPGMSNPIRYPFSAEISCSEHAIKEDVVYIGFKMPSGVSQCELADIQDEDIRMGNVSLYSEYCYGYYDPRCACNNQGSTTITNLPSDKGPQEEHYVIAKSTSGMFPGWKYNGQPITGKSNDGFMIINCGLKMNDEAALINGQVTNEGMICSFTARGLCEDTWYDFSAEVRDIDFIASDIIPTNVRFVAQGLETGEILMNYETGTISEDDWDHKSKSFNSKKNKNIKLILYNNQETNNTSCPIAGSDLGLDDIRFTRCAPRLGTFSDEQRVQNGYEICNRDNDVNVNLYSGHSAFGITDMIGTPWYVFFKSVDNGTWKAITTPTKVESYGYAQTSNTISVGNNTSFQYTSIVAGSEDAAKKMLEYLETKTPATYANDIENFVMDRTIDNYGCTLFAFSENITTFPVSCVVCTDSKAPVIEDYNECPTSETIDLFSLVKTITKADNTTVDISSATDKKAAVNAIGTITWYKKEGTTYNALPEDESVVTLPAAGETDTYAAKFKQKDEGTVLYCISDYSSDFTITPKETIVPTLNKLDISGCLQNLSREEDRTFKVESVDPNVTATYTWKTVNADNSETVIPGATGSSYILPEAGGDGTIMLYVTSATTCPSIGKKLTYSIADNPTFTLEGITVPCKDQIKDDGIKIKLSNMKGSNKLKITRTTKDANETKVLTFVSYDSENTEWIKNITYNGEEEFIFVDTYFEDDVIDFETFENVKYTITLGKEEDNCFQSTDTEQKEISSINDISLISNATNIYPDREVPEFHVCTGSPVTVYTDYELEPGEYFDWQINGVSDETDEAKQNQNYTIDEMTENTKFSVYIKANTGYQTCGGEEHLTVYVDQEPVIQKEDKDICYGDKNTKLNVSGGDAYEWTPSSTLSDDQISNPVANVNETTTYTVKVWNGVCMKTTNVTINVHPLPVIVSISPESEETKNNIVVTLEEEIGNTYYYSLDGTDYIDFPLDNIINSVPIGWSLLYIKDNNKCINTKEFYVEPIQIIPDKFFTPNGEGDERHEKWQIENLESYDSYIVEIFDRHGKRLFIQRVGSFNTGGINTVDGDEFEGWNGEYLGRPMPSDDYWYLITVEDIRKQYTGHFTLKR